MGNSSNAYVTKQANPVDPSEWINKQEEIGQYYTELKDRKEKEAQDRQDKLNDLADKTLITEIDWTTTGSKETDQILMPILQRSVTDLYETVEEAKNALEKYGRGKEYESAVMKNKTVSNRTKQIKFGLNMISSELKEDEKLLATGKYIQTPDYTKQLETLLEKTEIYQDSNKIMYVKQGDKVSEYSDWVKNFKTGGLLEKFEPDDYVKGVVAGIGEKKNKSENGFTTTSRTNSWEDYTDANGKKVKGIKSELEDFYTKDLDDNEVERMLATRGEFEYNKFSQEVKDKRKQELVDELVEKSRLPLKEALEIDFDRSGYNTAVENANDKNAGNTASSVTEPTEETFGNAIKNLNKYNALTVSSNGKVSSINGLTDVTPLVLTRDDNGKMVAYVSYQDSKSSKLSASKMEQELKIWEGNKNYNEKLNKYVKDGKTAEAESLRKERANKEIELTETSKTLGAQNKTEVISVPRDREGNFLSAAGISATKFDGSIKKQGDTTTKTESSTPKPKNEILSKDIAAKAKQSGYTEDEYRRLLEQRGVTIK